MLVDLKRMAAYICPFCSNISSKYISVFDFSGTGKLKLICPTHGCHEECVTVTPKSAGYKLDIECPLCGGTHSYTASKEGFWNKKLLAYKCSAAGMDIFFVGEKREVQQAIEDTSDAYIDVMTDSLGELEILDPRHEEEFNLMFEISHRLDELKSEHRFFCCCGSDKIERIADGGKIVLRCTRCRRSKVIDISNEMLTRLLNTTQIILGD